MNDDLFADTDVHEFYVRKITDTFLATITNKAHVLARRRITPILWYQWCRSLGLFDHRANEENIVRRGRQALAQIARDTLAKVHINTFTDDEVTILVDAFISAEVTAKLFATIGRGSSVPQFISQSGLWPPRSAAPTTLSAYLPAFASLAFDPLTEAWKREQALNELSRILLALLPTAIPLLVPDKELVQREVNFTFGQLEEEHRKEAQQEAEEEAFQADLHLCIRTIKWEGRSNVHWFNFDDGGGITMVEPVTTVPVVEESEFCSDDSSGSQTEEHGVNNDDVRVGVTAAAFDTFPPIPPSIPPPVIGTIDLSNLNDGESDGRDMNMVQRPQDGQLAIAMPEDDDLSLDSDDSVFTNEEMPLIQSHPSIATVLNPPTTSTSKGNAFVTPSSNKENKAPVRSWQPLHGSGGTSF
ncbi:hypothetical protein MIND_00425800 [Mycena indigotica]|uniref:Uncharacterized protein n=1 Tax=Mycena indigotica TaxID=2126181 RepID=A0A8H6W7Z9_9AGAR|nr:uncharacterized protein MIND_00425800 [Mycena indigotica]KAF7306346.1 hypothetical protein MIND_00425800 [Mycena indigotica]